MQTHKNIGFISNTGPDPLNIKKTTKPVFNVWALLLANEMPFKWCFVGGPIMVRL